MYFQLLFALDRVKALAPKHPEWKDKEPFASLAGERAFHITLEPAKQHTLILGLAALRGRPTREADLPLSAPLFRA